MDTMSRPAALLALLCILAACSSDPKESTEDSGVESEPAGATTAVPAAQTPTPTSPDTTAASMTPADTNTTTPAATLEEAAPPPEP
jgi:uncharacterized lipoprotein